MTADYPLDVLTERTEGTMNKAKTLDIIARKQREILELTERLNDAGHETQLTQTGVGSAVIVLVGRQLDPFALAAEQAFLNVTGMKVEITPEHALAVRQMIECTVHAGESAESLAAFKAHMERP